ncbi:hypothetical protein HFQ13_10720 [Acidithiobacillus sp. VAN18-1]|uniref:Uncharacterized protein n=1 Tax=Igneacidithiobacillus copahuensis TaxID=2724909 RepID=A0AAE2YR34_9PROT|nr:hypothetical protein [Igneacidithiobacillus copahuensis]MBU2788664.1 hypothetical protein [Igneacidithiobacillus copahuensis]MBU2796652.1 hypothetical protein [Acidithiobacillus sp. VAN18-2]
MKPLNISIYGVDSNNRQKAIISMSVQPENAARKVETLRNVLNHLTRLQVTHQATLHVEPINKEGRIADSGETPESWAVFAVRSLVGGRQIRERLTEFNTKEDALDFSRRVIDVLAEGQNLKMSPEPSVEPAKTSAQVIEITPASPSPSRGM